MTEIRHYIGIVHKDEASDFGISFPDFPGCISAGRTLEETVVMGREALEGHIGLMADDPLRLSG
jgi:predicted RNase H-like HicB family nuclease